MIGDSYAALWPVTAFLKHGINYQALPLSSSELYQHTIPLWTADRVSMLDHPRAVDQLCVLKRRLAQGGREQISHVRGGHDDVANSVAGLLWRLSPVEVDPVMRPVIVSSRREPAPGSAFSENAGRQRAWDRLMAEEMRLQPHREGFS